METIFISSRLNWFKLAFYMRVTPIYSFIIFSISGQKNIVSLGRVQVNKRPQEVQNEH